jgi:hypothetical protein
MRKVQFFGLGLVAAFALAALATAQEEKPAGTSDSRPSIKLAQPLTDAMTLDERLAAKATFHGTGSSIKSFAEELEGALDTSVVLAVKKLEEAAIHLETPLSFNLRNVKVQTALRLILDEHGLTFVTHDNVIVITTEEDAGAHLVTRVYDCRDLMKLPSPVKKVKKDGAMQVQSPIGTSGLPAKPTEKKGKWVRTEATTWMISSTRSPPRSLPIRGATWAGPAAWPISKASSPSARRRKFTTRSRSS